MVKISSCKRPVLPKLRADDTCVCRSDQHDNANRRDIGILPRADLSTQVASRYDNCAGVDITTNTESNRQMRSWR